MIFVDDPADSLHPRLFDADCCDQEDASARENFPLPIG